MPPLVIGTIFLAVTSIVLVLISTILKVRSEERIIKKRLDEYAKADKKEMTAIPFILRDDQMSRIPLFNHLLERLNITKNLSKVLRQTDLKIKVGELVLLMFICALVGGALTVRTEAIAAKITAPLFFFFLPVFFVYYQRTKRLRAFIREFPDAIDMIAAALRAGHAFPRSMQLVAEEAPEPVGVEFRKTFEEYNLGIELREALLNLTERIDSTDLRLFVTSVLLQKETGGNLTEILEKIGHTIRERFKLMGQLRTYTAQGRMSGWILGLLPVVFMVTISFLSPTYLDPLFTQKAGQYMLLVAIILQVVGFAIIRKIVQIKYQ